MLLCVNSKNDSEHTALFCTCGCVCRHRLRRLSAPSHGLCRQSVQKSGLGTRNWEQVGSDLRRRRRQWTLSVLQPIGTVTEPQFRSTLMTNALVSTRLLVAGRRLSIGHSGPPELLSDQSIVRDIIVWWQSTQWDRSTAFVFFWSLFWKFSPSVETFVMWRCSLYSVHAFILLQLSLFTVLWCRTCPSCFSLCHNFYNNILLFLSLKQ